MPIVIILGPRKSGKTTLVKQTFPNMPYVNLESLAKKIEVRNLIRFLNN